MSELKRLTDLAEVRMALAAKINDCEAELKTLKARLTTIDTEDLPELMEEVGMQSFKLSDGTEIGVKKDVKASITAAKAPAAMKWLVDNGYAGLIKSKVLVDCNREDAAQLQQQLPYEISVNDTVHPMTLKSFVVERLEKGDDIPFDLFGVHPFNKITVKK